MHPIEGILGPVGPMLETVVHAAESEGIGLSGRVLDHVCYRVSTPERYEECKEAISKFGTCISEGMIAGRPIATFLLETPLRFREFSIECVELLAPKPWSPYEDWWEHVECAVGVPPSRFMEEYPGISFGAEAIGKAVNPEIRRKYGKYALKFHEHPLRYVVEVLEKQA